MATLKKKAVFFFFFLFYSRFVIVFTDSRVTRALRKKSCLPECLRAFPLFLESDFMLRILRVPNRRVSRFAGLFYRCLFACRMTVRGIFRRSFDVSLYKSGVENQQHISQRLQTLDFLKKPVVSLPRFWYSFFSLWDNNSESAQSASVVKHATSESRLAFVLRQQSKFSGAMADRLGRGLQNLVERFDSASHLHFVSVIPDYWFGAFFLQAGRRR